LLSCFLNQHHHQSCCCHFFFFTHSHSPPCFCAWCFLSSTDSPFLSSSCTQQSGGQGGCVTTLRCPPPEATAKGRHQIGVAASGRHLIRVMHHPRALACAIICQRFFPYLAAKPRSYPLRKECKIAPSNARWLPMSVKRE
jgi:hypothetical protein